MSTSTGKRKSQSTTFAPTRQGGWLTAREAARIAGCSREALTRAADRGLIGTKHLPVEGARTWFSHEDVLRIAKESLRPARPASPDADAGPAEQPT